MLQAGSRAQEEVGYGSELSCFSPSLEWSMCHCGDTEGSPGTAEAARAHCSPGESGST